jgi:hypothetical protein
MTLLANIEAVNKNQPELGDSLLRITEAAQTQNADKLKALGKESENAKTRLPSGGATRNNRSDRSELPRRIGQGEVR